MGAEARQGLNGKKPEASLWKIPQSSQHTNERNLMDVFLDLARVHRDSHDANDHNLASENCSELSV